MIFLLMMGLLFWIGAFTSTYSLVCRLLCVMLGGYTSPLQNPFDEKPESSKWRCGGRKQMTHRGRPLASRVFKVASGPGPIIEAKFEANFWG